MSDFTEPVMDDATELASLLKNAKQSKNSHIRCCEKCDRYLKKSWNGNICSRCIYKQKYHAKILKNINAIFKSKGDESTKNPFLASNNVDFMAKYNANPTEYIKYITLLYKGLEMYMNPSEDIDTTIKRLDFYKKMYNDSLAE